MDKDPTRLHASSKNQEYTSFWQPWNIEYQKWQGSYLHFFVAFRLFEKPSLAANWYKTAVDVSYFLKTVVRDAQWTCRK